MKETSDYLWNWIFWRLGVCVLFLCFFSALFALLISSLCYLQLYICIFTFSQEDAPQPSDCFWSVCWCPLAYHKGHCPNPAHMIQLGHLNGVGGIGFSPFKSKLYGPVHLNYKPIAIAHWWWPQILWQIMLWTQVHLARWTWVQNYVVFVSFFFFLICKHIAEYRVVQKCVNVEVSKCECRV